MVELSKKIIKERGISKSLREASSMVDYNTSMKIREEQEKHWKKFNFLKNLNKAIEKVERGE